MNKLKNKNGITLVALIITIIVLLILAIVSINLVMNGGIIDKSKNAVDKYSQEEVQEQIKLAYSEWQMGQYTGVTDTAADFIKNKLNSIYGEGTVTNVTEESAGTFKIEFTGGKVKYYSVGTGKVVESLVELLPTAAIDDKPVQENSKYTVDGKTAVIPAGYKISTNPNEQSIDTGLVITKGGNEWVWIPVSNKDFSAMFGTATDDGWTMDGTDVKTKYKSNGGIINDKNGNPITTRVTPGDTSAYREPDVLNNNDYDKKTTNLSAAGLGAKLSDMATKLRDDYKNMIDSVRKNGGFYVGRYELSEAGTKKDQPSLVSTTWYNLYAKCKTFGDESTTYSRMIWGCQWDQICKFINTSGDQVSLTDSRTYGNYYNSLAPANAGNYSQGTKQNTGSNENWKANNIYDLAGNCYEWTQEADYTDGRAIRGGVYDEGGDGNPVALRSNFDPTYTYDVLSSRPVLYLK